MRTIAVTEDRSSPMATSRRRSALGEAWRDGAVLMSFLAVLGLSPGCLGRRFGVGLAVPGRAAAVASGAVTHSIHTP